MFEKNRAEIDGDGNLVIQDSVININDTEELRQFLIESNEKLEKLPYKIITLLEQKSQQMEDKIEKGANLYLTTIADVGIVKVHKASWGITITNLTREIRYFNQPYFVVSPQIELWGGQMHDTFVFVQKKENGVKFPYRLEFGQTVDCNFPIKEGAFKLFQDINEKNAFIQAFTTTTIGEIYSSKKYSIPEFIEQYKSVYN